MTREASNKKRKVFLNVTASEISPASELIAKNVDLLTEILVRLPVKSIIRFRSVSKHWLSLLSDSEFATMNNTRSSRPISAMAQEQNQEVVILREQVQLYAQVVDLKTKLLTWRQQQVANDRANNESNKIQVAKLKQECEAHQKKKTEEIRVHMADRLLRNETLPTEIQRSLEDRRRTEELIENLQNKYGPVD